MTDKTLIEAVQRLEAYAARRKKSRGIDIEGVHSFDLGEPSEAVLLLSDIECVARAAIAQQAGEPVATPMNGEIALIEKAAHRAGITSLLNHGAASCVYSEGCAGVSQEHFLAYTREIALHCAVALATPQPAPAAEWITDRHPEWASRDDTPCRIGNRDVPPTLESANVLVALDGGGVRVDRFTAIEGSPGWWKTFGQRVVAWQPTPPPPARKG